MFFSKSMCLFYISLLATITPLMCELIHLIFTGTFGLALATTYNRFSLWAAAVPITCGIIVVLISWVSLRSFFIIELGFPTC